MSLGARAPAVLNSALLCLAACALGGLPARGAPTDDPTVRLLQWELRAGAVDALLGVPDRSPLVQASWLSAIEADEDRGDEAVRVVLGAELEAERLARAGDRPWSRPTVSVRPFGRLSAGGLAPPLAGGDVELGLLSVRGGLDARAYPGLLELAARPELGLDLSPAAPSPVSPSVAVREAWAGLRAPTGPQGEVSLGFGLRDRWMGPGRFGSVLLTDAARPAPAGAFALGGRVPFVGRLRGEAGAGWLDGERGDVPRPGWLWMDLRWAPVSWVELGAGRVALFGGEGRPTPDISQLILPLEPHVYDDPDQLLPDQDELAALDARLLLPIARWTGRRARLDELRGVDMVELYWQYGGEDVIGQRTLGIPYPSLAGVGNLVGGELTAGPLSLNVEHTRLLDDTFRWYTGHRVYHDGFYRDGLPMGHPGGGDMISDDLALTFLQPRWGVSASGGRRLRVGGVSKAGSTLITLSTEERGATAGIEGWLRDRELGWWVAGLQVEQRTGADFIPGARDRSLRLTLGRR